MDHPHRNHSDEERRRPQVGINANVAPELLAPSFLPFRRDVTADDVVGAATAASGVKEGELRAEDRAGDDQEGGFLGEGSMMWEFGVEEGVVGRGVAAGEEGAARERGGEFREGGHFGIAWEGTVTTRESAGRGCPVVLKMPARGNERSFLRVGARGVNYGKSLLKIVFYSDPLLVQPQIHPHVQRKAFWPHPLAQEASKISPQPHRPFSF